MTQRRGVLALLVPVMFVSSIAVFAQTDKKRDEALRRESQASSKSVDDVMAGQPVPNDLGIVWVREDVLKAQGNKQYVPFTVQVDTSKVTGSSVAMYWRVIAKNPAAAPTEPAPGKKDDKKDDKKDKKASLYAYEDVTLVPVVAGQSPMRISRSFTVPGGGYDVVVEVKELTPEKPAKNAPPLKTSVIKQAVTVPDFWNGELATSTVLLAARIDPLPAPLTPIQQADRPYALGMMEIVPTFDNKLSKKSELSTFMLIYNPKVDSANKPDISVEYNFYQKLAGQPEKFFNKTNPQNLNAQTLPPNFDFAAGHQLQSGQAVPLASFPEGDYRLEIKVTDKLANKSLTREVVFTVSPS
jgi:hypothetical protein